MAANNSFWGKPELSFGPAQAFWDSDSGGVNLDLGGVDSIVVTKSITKIGLREAQAGDRDADRAISAQQFDIVLGMSRATIDRNELVVQGFEVERDSGGEPIRLYGVDLVGQLDSSVAKQLTIHEIIEGGLSTDAREIIDFLKVAPNIESNELTFDAATQRFYSVAFLVYKHDTITSPNGKPVYWRSRLVA